MANVRIKARIEDARAEVRSATLPDKEGLLDQLAAADEAINGTPDKIGALAELVALRTAAEAVQAVRLPEVIAKAAKNAVDTHAGACAGRAAQLKPGTWPWVLDRALRSWPLAIVASVLAIAPNGARILDAVAGLIEKVTK
jgi:hypothetical protein